MSGHFRSSRSNPTLLISGAVKTMLRYALDYPARARISKNRRVKISNTATISKFRKMVISDGGQLTIGDNALIEGSIVMEHPEACVIVGSRTYIGESMIASANEITIGDDVLVAWGCTIVDHDSHAVSWSKRANDVGDWAKGIKNWQHVNRGTVHIGNKVWVGVNVTILKNVSIGEGAVIGAGSVVTKDVPAWTVVVGCPARAIRLIPENER